MNIGFIGLGAMGRAMAANLVAAGHRVRAWNRAGGQPVQGLDMVPDAAHAFEADIVVTMLSDDAAIRQVLLDTGVVAGARKGIVHIVCSTISVALSAELASIHEAAGVGFVAAPVLGRPDVAKEGQLNILIGGEKRAIETVRPILAILGKTLWVMGDDPTRATAAKIAANMMIAMAIEALAEAVVLTESTGLPRETFFELILGTLFSGRAYESYSSNIARRHFEPGFKARLGLKDMRLATDAAAMTGQTLPMLDAMRARMAEAVDAGMGERDWSAMAEFTIGRAHP